MLTRVLPFEIIYQHPEPYIVLWNELRCSGFSFTIFVGSFRSTELQKGHLCQFEVLFEDVRSLNFGESFFQDLGSFHVLSCISPALLNKNTSWCIASVVDLTCFSQMHTDCRAYRHFANVARWHFESMADVKIFDLNWQDTNIKHNFKTCLGYHLQWWDYRSSS